MPSHNASYDIDEMMGRTSQPGSNTTQSTSYESARTGSISVAGGGDERGGSFSVGVPLYTSRDNSWGVSASAGRSGGWSSDRGSSYSAGVGFSYRF